MESPLTPRILHTIHDMQRTSEQLRLEKKKIAVVPTMGYLHRGHVNLIERPAHWPMLSLPPSLSIQPNSVQRRIMNDIPAISVTIKP